MTTRITPAIVSRHLPGTLQSMLAGDGAFKPRRAPRGTIMVRENDRADHSILLLNGWISLSKTLPSGDVQIIDLMLPGDFALVGTQMVPVAAATMEALSDVEYILIGPEQANGPSAASATLRHVLAACILTTQSRTSELLLRLGRGTAANRIAYALLEVFIRLQAVGLVKGTRFEFPITQQKFGEFTGMTNVHVCRTLRRFETEGLIGHPDHQSIELLNLPALCALADIDLTLLRQEILMRWPVPA
ncbi:Crp/Fnr family transcriptional regulator [Roseovarius dicentrarchi]|uniref:Crp/Fnr family transcriptional regulator n=1 Tax=Roseovarius dicentrarchi TaxID=2250573 RepID=UPI0013967000|nr:Crp/Fnr family transcriptional regulator [Roseovarius dicentrarchi]